MNDLRPTGFLSPTGEFIECDYMDHIIVAEELCEKLGYTEAIYHPTDILLEKFGFVQMSMSVLICWEYHVFWDSSHHLTEEQKNFLRPIFEANDENLAPIDYGSILDWENENK